MPTLNAVWLRERTPSHLALEWTPDGVAIFAAAGCKGGNLRAVSRGQHSVNVVEIYGVLVDKTKKSLQAEGVMMSLPIPACDNLRY